jgi:hypothetical protein
MEELAEHPWIVTNIFNETTLNNGNQIKGKIVK